MKQELLDKLKCPKCGAYLTYILAYDITTYRYCKFPDNFFSDQDEQCGDSNYSLKCKKCNLTIQSFSELNLTTQEIDEIDEETSNFELIEE